MTEFLQKDSVLMRIVIIIRFFNLTKPLFTGLFL